jgi:hypothetical protein
MCRVHGIGSLARELGAFISETLQQGIALGIEGFGQRMATEDPECRVRCGRRASPNSSQGCCSKSVIQHCVLELSHELLCYKVGLWNIGFLLVEGIRCSYLCT